MQCDNTLLFRLPIGDIAPGSQLELLTVNQGADSVPVHPGKVLKQDFMEPRGLSATALAAAIGVTPARVREIVRCRRGITAETALRLAEYFSTDAQCWMNLQGQYELALAKRESHDALAAIIPGERRGPTRHDFWTSPTLDELAKAQNVGPLDTAALRGTWPGEDDDGFEEAIDELRHEGLKKMSNSAAGDSDAGRT